MQQEGEIVHAMCACKHFRVDSKKQHAKLFPNCCVFSDKGHGICRVYVSTKNARHCLPTVAGLYACNTHTEDEEESHLH